MKNQGLVLIIALFWTGLVSAQPGKPDSVEIEIDRNRISVGAEDLEALSSLDLNSIIREVVAKTAQIQAQQMELIARIDRQEERGEISEEEADELRESVYERTEESMEVIGELMENWGEAYGERWEAWAEEYEARMENWENEIEMRVENDRGVRNLPPLPPLPDLPPPAPAPAEDGPASPDKKPKKIIISDKGIVIQPGEEGDEPFALKFDREDKEEDHDHQSIDRTETYLDLHFGFNQLLENGQYVIIDEPGELNFWKSTQFEVGMGGKSRIGSPYSKLYLKWGGSFSWHDFRLIGNNILTKNASGRALFLSDSNNAYSKSKYEIVYLNIPLMLQLDFSEVGDRDESFTIGLGAYGGVRLSSGRELEFNDMRDGSEVEEDVKNDFATNRFRYGLMAQIGWGALKLSAQYDLNSYFRENRGPLNSDNMDGNYQLAALSIGFTL